MEDLLCCPVCGQALRETDTGLICPNRHSFDRARQGYVNLLPVTQKHSRNPGDTRDMVAARREFLDRGYYAPIAEKLRQLALPLLPECPYVLDAGCGEGYYLTRLQECFAGGCFFGVDISKDAVRFAAARNKNAVWLTASAAHLPLRDGCLDMVLGMFSLSAPEEFLRVLKPGGYYLEVTAGRDHLMGLKALIYPKITEKAPKLTPGYPGFSLLADTTLTFSFTLRDTQDIVRLLSMTPHFWRITGEGAERARNARELRDTAEVLFRIYQKKPSEG